MLHIFSFQPETEAHLEVLLEKKKSMFAYIIGK